ncbi:MAG: ABC transporter ATP-binding protein [bacterium]|nr:ABC transporter ATP-binding protein [bacterium]MCP4305624.1 ABC transporter ATP-binding protein [bacterium]
MSLKVEPGMLVTLLGPSGCGKTTTLRMIAGLEMATSGRILIGDADVTLLPATERDVSMVFQSYALFPHMTVLENIEYGLKFSGFAKSEVRARAAAGLELVGLAGFDKRLPSELSGGQQQRVAVARALVLEPQVLLFDEPLSNLDAKLRRQVREEIRDIQTSLGLTVVYVTHDQEEALAVSDRIVVMNNAVISQEGTPRDLYESPANAFVADFIGEANIFDCEITTVTDGEAEIRLGGLKWRLASRGLGVGAARLAVRPNRVLLAEAGGNNTFDGTLSKATYVGSHVEFTVDSDHGKVFATSLETDLPFAAGQAVGVTFSRNGPVLLNDQKPSATST